MIYLFICVCVLKKCCFCSARFLFKSCRRRRGRKKFNSKKKRERESEREGRGKNAFCSADMTAAPPGKEELRSGAPMLTRPPTFGFMALLAAAALFMRMRDDCCRKCGLCVCVCGFFLLPISPLASFLPTSAPLSPHSLSLSLLFLSLRLKPGYSNQQIKVNNRSHA